MLGEFPPTARLRDASKSSSGLLQSGFAALESRRLLDIIMSGNQVMRTCGNADQIAHAHNGALCF